MRKARNINEVNVYKVFTNAYDEITDEVLIATFLNERYALDFIRNNTDNTIGGYVYLDMRVNTQPVIDH